MFDKEKYSQLVCSRGLKGKYIAEKIGMDYRTYLQRTSGANQWKVDEVMRVQRILKLRNHERDAIFFAKEVSKVLTKDGE